MSNVVPFRTLWVKAVRRDAALIRNRRVETERIWRTGRNERQVRCGDRGVQSTFIAGTRDSDAVGHLNKLVESAREVVDVLENGFSFRWYPE